QPYFEMMIDQAQGKGTVPTDFCGTLSDSSVQWEVGPKAAAGTKATLQTIEAELKAGTRKVFDCSTFTVGGEHLTSYMADVNTDADFTKDTEVVKTVGTTTYFSESDGDMRSAPYFDITIDGITLLNTKF
ncbi:MAG: BMP family ABC transporter substrate-binding protein, partial [Clostridia bacterium]|nr:BMP family ABC transporter substrate-binding protein [Clostridia bacterium]